MTEIEHNTDWRKALLMVDVTIKDAIRNLDETTFQIVLVTDRDGILLGTITDGDIRRGLLQGLSLDSSIEPIIKHDPLVAPPQMDRETSLLVMRANGIRQLPVVDDQKRVVDLFLMKELLRPHRRPNSMIIMAGGKGTRLRPYTEKCPKPLLPVSGKPMLEHIIERARGEGFEHFILAIHYLGSMIEEYCGDGSRWKVSIDYVRETEPLGTAGALSLLEQPPSYPFLVTNGDVLTDIQYGEVLDFHARNQAVATMAVQRHEWQHPFGVVRTKGIDIINFEEKPVYRTHVNAGVYVLEPRALDFLDAAEPCDMPTLFEKLKRNGDRTIVYPMHEPWIDVGRLADYQHAEHHFSKTPDGLPGEDS
jgi:dTDP-glucose pyrophosphorylase